jgi:hypothetical protein
MAENKDKSVFLTSTDDPQYVDSIALIKVAQEHGIKISDMYPRVKTLRQLAELRDWVYGEIKKLNPSWEPPKK